MTKDQLEEFQKSHGRQWAKIIGMSSFNAGMIHLKIQAMEQIRTLSDDEITRNAVTILSGLRGLLQHEFQLFGLPVITDDEPLADLREEYPEQINEAFEEQQRELNRNRIP